MFALKPLVQSLGAGVFSFDDTFISCVHGPFNNLFTLQERFFARRTLQETSQKFEVRQLSSRAKQPSGAFGDEVHSLPGSAEAAGTRSGTLHWPLGLEKSVNQGERLFT